MIRSCASRSICMHFCLALSLCPSGTRKSFMALFHSAVLIDFVPTTTGTNFSVHPCVHSMAPSACTNSPYFLCARCRLRVVICASKSSALLGLFCPLAFTTACATRKLFSRISFFGLAYRPELMIRWAYQPGFWHISRRLAYQPGFWHISPCFCTTSHC